MRALLLVLKNYIEKKVQNTSKRLTIPNVTVALTVVFAVILVAQKIEYKKEIHEAKEENLTFLSEAKEAENSMVELMELFINQGLVIRKYEEYMRNAGAIIQEEQNIINKLIQYLKSINHWPPKIEFSPEDDPSRWTTLSKET